MLATLGKKATLVSEKSFTVFCQHLGFQCLDLKKKGLACQHAVLCSEANHLTSLNLNILVKCKDCLGELYRCASDSGLKDK